MNMKRIVIFGLLMAAIAPIPLHAQFQGSPSSESVPPPPAVDKGELDGLLTATRPQLRFRADDTLSIEVYGMSSYASGQRIAQDGTLVLPFIGKIHVAGLTVQELQEKVTGELKAKGIVQDPQVTVVVGLQPWAVVTVAGSVGKPGMFPAYGRLTVLDYLSAAGGFRDNLSGGTWGVSSPASTTVTLVRPTLTKPVSIPLGPDPMQSPYGSIPLFPGDQIKVSRVGVVYALGAFRQQGAFPLKSTSPTTVLQLAALAGGIGWQGDIHDAHIIRTEGANRFILDINVQKILKGKRSDVALRPDDIFFVPTNAMKAAIKGGGTNGFISIATAAIYTHP